jgi:hypothetical protein
MKQAHTVAEQPRGATYRVDFGKEKGLHFSMQTF